MILGTLMGYAKRRFAMTAGQAYGRIVAHEELAKHLLRQQVVTGVHVFSHSTRTPIAERERQECEAGIDEAFTASEARPAFKHLTTFHDVVSAADHVFLSGGPETHRLAQMRDATPRQYPITTLIHSVNWFDLLAFYLAMLATRAPYDTLVATSAAAETAVRVVLGWVRQTYGVDTDISIARIPLGVDLDDVPQGDRSARRVYARAVVGWNASDVVALYTGRLTEEFKADLEPLIAVVARLVVEQVPVRLVLAGQDRGGDGYSGRLRAMAVAAGIGGCLRIIENPPDVVKLLLYEASDLFVSPADNIQESFGISLLEAMSHGLPIVATDWSGYRDIVEDGTSGLLLPTYWDPEAAELASAIAPADQTTGTHYRVARHTIADVDALYERLRTLLADSGLRQRMGDAGRRRVEDCFAWPRVAQQYRELFAAQQCTRARVGRTARPSLSLNEVFSHYATTTLSDAMIVHGTPYGEQLLDRHRRAVGILPRAAERVLTRILGHEMALAQLRRELSPDEWTALMGLLKSGRLGLRTA